MPPLPAQVPAPPRILWGPANRTLLLPFFWLPPVLLSLTVIGANLHGFLIAHILAELFTVMIGWAFFALGWKTYSLNGNRLLVLLGWGLFWVGAIDLVHIMAYKGMHLLPIDGGNASTQTWIAARLMQIVSLLLMPFLARRHCPVLVVFLCFGIAAVGILVAIFNQWLPPTFIEGTGLTPLKVGMEFLIIALSVLAIPLVVNLPEDLLRADDKPFLIYAIVLSMIMEIVLSFYTDLYAESNVVGHILKIWSFWLIFHALVQINLIQPHRTQQRLSEVIRQSTAMVVITDRMGLVEYVNPQFETDTGYTAAEVLGHNIKFLQSDEQPQQIVESMWKAISRGEVWRGHFRNRRKDGSLYWDQSVISPIRDEKGEISSYVALKEDVTQKRQVEEFLLNSNNAVARVLVGALQAMVGLLEARDPYTADHSRRVGAIAVLIAEAMGLPQSQIEGLRLAALIHDIGKIRVPMEILNKPGALSATEFELIKQHPQVAYNAIKDIPFPWDVPTIILAHHEKWDGSGYPNGWKGERIPLEAQILTVADCLEAISSHRPYRPSLGSAKAFEIIGNENGKSFSPAVVAAAMRVRAQITALIDG